jgi:hypothetical protein
VIGGLIVVAAAILLTGLIVAIRDLRRPAQVAAAPTAPLRDASLPDGGPSGGYPTTRGDDDERDQRAIAA